MSSTKKHITFSDSDCISEQMMFDYIDNKLRQKEQHEVEKHLIDCELCSDALDGLRLVKNRNKIRIVNQRIKEKIILKGIPIDNKPAVKIVSVNYKIIFAVAAGLLFVCGLVIFFKQYVANEVKENSIAELKTPPPTIIEKKLPEPKTIENTSKKNVEETLVSTQNSQVQFSIGGNTESTPDIKGKDNGVPLPSAATGASVITALEQSVKVNAGKEANRKGLSEEGKTAGLDETIDNSIVSKTLTDKKDASKNTDTEKISYTTIEKKKEKPAKTNEDKDVSGYATPSIPSTLGGDGVPQIETVSTKSVSRAMSDSVSNAFETLPEFPGGNEELKKFISSNFHRPETVAYNSIATDATILIKFTVESTGKLKHYKILKGVSKELNREALHLISIMPNWKPATLNGKAIEADYTLTLPLQ